MEFAAAGKPQLGCSASGRCVSVVWPHAREYLIFIAGEAGTWDKLTEGVGTHLVPICWPQLTADASHDALAGFRGLCTHKTVTALTVGYQPSCQLTVAFG